MRTTDKTISTQQQKNTTVILRLFVPVILIIALLSHGTFALVKVWSCDFSNDSCGITGGTYDSTNQVYRQIDSWGVWQFNKNFSNYTHYKLQAAVFWNDTNTQKWYINTRTGYADGAHPLVEYISGYQRVQSEPGYYNYRCENIPTPQWSYINISYNRTSGAYTFEITGCNWTYIPSPADTNYSDIRIETGLNPFAVDNLSLLIPDDDPAAPTPTVGNEAATPSTLLPGATTYINVTALITPPESITGVKAEIEFPDHSRRNFTMSRVTNPPLTNSWALGFSDTALAGTYYVRNFWVTMSGGSTIAKPSTLSFFVLTVVTITNEAINPTTVSVNGSTYINTTADVTPPSTITSLKAEIEFPNGTRRNYSLPRITNPNITTSWAISFSDTALSGRYYWRNTYALISDGSTYTHPESLSFVVPAQISIAWSNPTGDRGYRRYAADSMSVRVDCLTPGNCGVVNVYLDPVISPTTAGFNGETLADNYERYMMGWQTNNQVKAVQIRTVGGQQLLLVPKMGGIDGSCTTSNLDGGKCGASGTVDDFCIVTDQQSQYTLALSMSRNTTLLSQQARPAFNTIQYFAPSGRSVGVGIGKNTAWVWRYNGGALNYTDPNSASDADARMIAALWNFYHNPYLQDSQLKSEIHSYVTQYCSDYRTYVYTKPAINLNSRVGSGRIINNWLSGGAAEAASGLGGGPSQNPFTWAGYNGDATIAMLACGANLNDSTYYKYVNDSIEEYLHEAYWTSSTGFRVPAGASGHFDNTTNPTSWICQAGNDCSGTDDADAVRFVKMCTALYFAEMANVSTNDKLAEFCDELKNSRGITSNSYCKQWFTNGTPCKGNDNGTDMPHNGLASFVDIGVWRDNFATRQTYTGANNYNVGNQYFTNEANCQAVYWPAFLVNALGVGIGYADASFPAQGRLPVSQSKGLVSTTPGAQPFYSYSSNPANYTRVSCLSNFNGGSTCNVSWGLNSTGSIDSTWTFVAYAESDVVNGAVTTYPIHITITS